MLQAQNAMPNTELHDPLLPIPCNRHALRLRQKLASQLCRFQESMEELSPEKMIVLVLIFGCGTGVVAWVYNSFFEAVVHVAWEKLPQHVVQPVLQHLSKKVSWVPTVDRTAWVYTVVLSTFFGFLAGMTQRVLGSPGDLPDTVRDIHEKGYISISKAPSMFLCSTFSIAAGGSLGPEAPLLALCGASCSWFGRRVLHYKGQKLRNCALLGETVFRGQCSSLTSLLQSALICVRSTCHHCCSAHQRACCCRHDCWTCSFLWCCPWR